MIVRNVARGQSFKKLAAYLTSPREGQHRALWSHVENAGTEDARTAAKIMAHTAMNADAIKERAGVKKGGRKAEGGPVYHIVMSWPEQQRPDAAHQLDSARELLRSIGMDKAQAVIVAHNDNGKEHIHLMVNLVDPATGKRFSLSNDRHKMDAWATEYAQRHGTLEQTPKRAEREAAKAQAKPRPQRSEKISRPVMDAADRAARADYQKRRAEREAAYTRQAGERADLYREHGAQWAQARAEAAQHKAAYKAAFRAAYGKAKAEDRAANKPKWRDLLRKQEADRASMTRAVEFARERADRARREAKQATAAMVAAERRSRSAIGRLAQRIGLAATPDRATARQSAAAEAMRQAAFELAAVELAKAGLATKQDGERAALAKALGGVTFAKAQLAVDTMPRADFAALVNRQTAEKAALIEQQNAERDALGMKRYDPKPSRKDDPMTRPLAEQDKTRNAFNVSADRRQAKPQQPQPVQGAFPTLKPDGSRGPRSTPAAPVQQRPAPEQDTTRTSMTVADLAGPQRGFTLAIPQRRASDRQAEAKPISPLAAARERNNTPEAKAERVRQAELEKQRDRSRDRDDFER